MAAILAAYDDAEKAIAALANLKASPYSGLLLKDSPARLLAFSSAEEEVERLKLAYPGLKARRASRFLDNREGGMRGAILGIFFGIGLIQLLGFGLYYWGNLKPAALQAGSGFDVSSAGALMVLFLGFFGGLAGGSLGYFLGQKWLGLPPEIARRYEYRLERGETILAVNRRRLLFDRPPRMAPLKSSPTGNYPAPVFSLERFYFWLGEYGAHDTRRVTGSVAALKVNLDSPDKPLISPFFYTGEPRDEDESRDYK